uniref:Secreted protein n=1 Tax=Achlya hypogyna TaxID=1202772 RepID=A0A0A7CPH3_ACHHY|nr:secreted protein [Achlya hypogyna]
MHRWARLLLLVPLSAATSCDDALLDATSSPAAWACLESTQRSLWEPLSAHDVAAFCATPDCTFYVTLALPDCAWEAADSVLADNVALLARACRHVPSPCDEARLRTLLEDIVNPHCRQALLASRDYCQLRPCVDALRLGVAALPACDWPPDAATTIAVYLQVLRQCDERS